MKKKKINYQVQNKIESKLDSFILNDVLGYGLYLKDNNQLNHYLKRYSKKSKDLYPENLSRLEFKRYMIDNNLTEDFFNFLSNISL